jgi:LacI family transcriptional regulator
MKPESKSLPEIANVALLIDTSTEWSRKIIAGINTYTRLHGAWHLFVEPHGSNEPLELARGWKGHGVIADIRDEDLAARLRKTRLPVVNISCVTTKSCFPRVTVDRTAACRMAVNYYLERGYRNLAYISVFGNEWDAETRDQFTRFAAESGATCSTYEVKGHAWGAPDWNLNIRSLGVWLRSLPKPVGIFSWAVGREVVHACRVSGIKIPEEVALLLTAYDEVFSEASHVPMSGLLHNLEEVGHEAARMLDALMHGTPLAALSLEIPPLSVKTLQSTDTLAIRDAAMLKALSFLRETIGTPVQVEDVARHAGISRRVLERRFLDTLGRTPAEHIRHIRLERARQLLRESNLPIPAVADAAGFGSPEYMACMFQKRLGMSPLKYRHHARHGQGMTK